MTDRGVGEDMEGRVGVVRLSSPRSKGSFLKITVL